MLNKPSFRDFPKFYKNKDFTKIPKLAKTSQQMEGYELI